MVLSRTRIALGAIMLGSGIATVIPTTAAASSPEEDDAAALALPGPNGFVSGLDLECFDTPGPALNINLTLSHLNPVLQQLGLPTHVVGVRQLAQTCVPVMKNGVPPQPTALPFIRHVDFACYTLEAAALPAPVPLALKHLNPVLANLPLHGVRLLRPEQLCVPVFKNTIVPPPDVRALVQFLDLECYTTEAGAHPTFGVSLQQLNPQLANIPVHPLTLVPQPRKLCVPVRKNNQVIPTDVLSIIRWVDLEKFAAQPIGLPPVNVVLRHLNPLLANFPPVPVVLQRAIALMVPVSKNGATPPPP